VNAATSYFRSIGKSKADPELLDLASSLIERKSAPFDASEFHDRYVDALHRLIDKKVKAKGKRVIEEVDEPGAKSGASVIDLMAALKASVEGKGSASSKARAAPPRSKKTHAAAAPAARRKRSAG
jgi:DNA end-binding protein Ku